MTAAARRADTRGSAEQAVRFLRRALQEDASPALRRSALLDLGAAESAARMPEAAGRMEEAQRLSSGPAEQAQAALGLSMVRFLAADVPGAVAACEDALPMADRLDRELHLGLEFQAAAARLVGGLPSPETFVRLLALEPEVRRGDTAAERSLLAMMAVVFAATTAAHHGRGGRVGRDGLGRRTAPRRGPVGAPGPQGARDGDRADGRHGRPRAHGQAEPGDRGGDRRRRGGTGAQLDAALLHLAGAPRVVREWSGDLGGAEADGVAALALLPAGDPIVLPVVLSALTDVYVERGSPGPRWRCCATPGHPASCRRRSASARRWLPAAGSRCGWATRGRRSPISRRRAGARRRSSTSTRWP